MKKKLKTAIWAEIPDKHNAFAAKNSFLRGENFFGQLVSSLSYSEMLFFTLCGKKPTEIEAEKFNLVLNACSNPGIRDEASRSAMNCSVGKGPLVNSVLAGLLTRTGTVRGSEWIKLVMINLMKCNENGEKITGSHQYSGLGKHFGSADYRASELISVLSEKKHIEKFQRLLIDSSDDDYPVLLEGLIAAAFLDLNFTPDQGAFLFLISSAAAFFAFSEEQGKAGYKEYPSFFGKDEYQYVQPDESQ
ncbi:MAG: hypothetical protein HQM10_15970 [Candidatus Riflebacteria bacterium]|nr:hypothetical protein [Candidatus Riflebacteria bacterium]